MWPLRPCFVARLIPTRERWDVNDGCHRGVSTRQCVPHLCLAHQTHQDWCSGKPPCIPCSTTCHVWGHHKLHAVVFHTRLLSACRQGGSALSVIDMTVTAAHLAVGDAVDVYDDPDEKSYLGGVQGTGVPILTGTWLPPAAAMNVISCAWIMRALWLVADCVCTCMIALGQA